MNLQTTVNGQSNSVSMTSVELLKVINIYRLQDGKNEMRHNNFMQKIRDEFDQEALHSKKNCYMGKDNAKSTCYDLDKNMQIRMLLKEGIEIEGYQVVGVRDAEFCFYKLLLSAFPEFDWVRQKYVAGYRIDFYCQNINLAVEYDEDYHNSTKRSALDRKRENTIISKLECSFIRIKKGDEGRGLIDIQNFIVSNLQH